MGKTRPPYPEQFRREAVELLRSSGRSVRQIAKDLGVSEQTLYVWLRRHEVDVGKRPGLSADEREELRALRRENRLLLQEREILAKATASFSGRSDRSR